MPRKASRLRAQLSSIGISLRSFEPEMLWGWIAAPNPSEESNSQFWVPPTVQPMSWAALSVIYQAGHGLGVLLDQPLIRRLIVLELWQARDSFDPTRLMQKFSDGRDFDWDDLRRLLNRAVVIDRNRIVTDCLSGFGFLTELTPDEQLLSNDEHQRQRALADELRAQSRRAESNGPTPGFQKVL